MNAQEVIDRIYTITCHEREVYRSLSLARRKGYQIYDIDPSRLTYDFWIGYSDVYGTDQLLIKRDGYSDVQIHIVCQEEIYLGHVYTWKCRDTLYVQGIRSSLTNTLSLTPKRGIARTLITYLISMSDNYILSIQKPLPTMIPILESYGFRDDDDDYLYP